MIAVDMVIMSQFLGLLMIMMQVYSYIVVAQVVVIELGWLIVVCIGKKSHTFYYYPCCKKVIGTGIANVLGHKSRVDILKAMRDEDPKFQFGLGHCPYIRKPS